MDRFYGPAERQCGHIYHPYGRGRDTPADLWQLYFTSGAGLVDGSFVRLPSWGCYTLDGKDIEMTGVTPDIKVINTFEDKISGRDPQLDKAIEEALVEIKNR